MRRPAHGRWLPLSVLHPVQMCVPTATSKSDQTSSPPTSPEPPRPNPHSPRGTVPPHLSRVHSLEAFGHRPRCVPHRRIGPASETLHKSGRSRAGPRAHARSFGRDDRQQGVRARSARGYTHRPAALTAASLAITADLPMTEHGKGSPRQRPHCMFWRRPQRAATHQLKAVRCIFPGTRSCPADQASTR